MYKFVKVRMKNPELKYPWALYADNLETILEIEEIRRLKKYNNYGAIK